jgi:hypothetical protein
MDLDLPPCRPLTLLDAQLERNILAGPYGPLPPPVVDANLDIPPIWGHRFNTITSPYGLVFVGLDHNHQQSLVFSFRANLGVMSLPEALSFLLRSLGAIFDYCVWNVRVCLGLLANQGQLCGQRRRWIWNRTK